MDLRESSEKEPRERWNRSDLLVLMRPGYFWTKVESADIFFRENDTMMAKAWKKEGYMYT